MKSESSVLICFVAAALALISAAGVFGHAGPVTSPAQNSSFLSADESQGADDSEGSDQDAADRSQLVEQLRSLNPMIGRWRGTGQPVRGSVRGAWRETAVARWDFSDGKAAIVVTAEESKQYQRLRLSSDPESAQLVVSRVSADGTVTEYRGKVPADWESRVVLTSRVPDGQPQQRCTLNGLSEIRFTVLFEEQRAAGGSFRRVAEIGYTRAGERLAQTGQTGRVCIVTGGQGTISVAFEGRTYFVCCEGCRQAFEESPAEFVAAYQAGLKKKE